MNKLSNAVEKITKSLVDDGKLIEAGFASMIYATYDGKKLPEDQLLELRQAFFGGAQHLFGSIMSFLDSGDEPTDKDLQRMDLVDRELKRFVSEYARDHYPTKGSA